MLEKKEDEGSEKEEGEEENADHEDIEEVYDEEEMEEVNNERIMGAIQVLRNTFFREIGPPHPLVTLITLNLIPS